MNDKRMIVFLLLSGILQILASDSHDKSLKISNDDFNSEELKYTQSNKKDSMGEISHPAVQFKKDYSQWNEKHYFKPKSKKFNEFTDHVKYNEIESNEYVDNYNKYGKTFNPDLIKAQKYKMYVKKRASEKEKYGTENDKIPSLLHDVNLNYINDKKEVEKLPSLLHDTDVNYVNNNKEISGDSEMITDKNRRKNKENYQENYQNGNDLHMKRYKKNFTQNLSKIDLSSPPPANETVQMARYIVHAVDWAALATLSARASTKGAPFVCVKATSDGMKNESSGIPFFYMSPRDLCTQDLQKDNRVSVLVTLSETEYCKNQNLDPQDPRCAKLTLSGKIKKIKPGSDEEKFAKNAVFSRHPAMKSWPADHNWYFTKLKIGQIILLDHFGGATYIKVQDYLNGKVIDSEHRHK